MIDDAGDRNNGRKPSVMAAARAWQRRDGVAIMRGMSTISEIESAIERLPGPQVAQLATWLDNFRRRGASDGGEHCELDVLIGTWREDAAFDAAVRAFAQVDEAMWK